MNTTSVKESEIFATRTMKETVHDPTRMGRSKKNRKVTKKFDPPIKKCEEKIPL